MHTVKLCYKNDSDVFLIIGNIDSIIYRENPISGNDYLINFPGDYHIAFSEEFWFLAEVL